MSLFRSTKKWVWSHFWSVKSPWQNLWKPANRENLSHPPISWFHIGKVVNISTTWRCQTLPWSQTMILVTKVRIVVLETACIYFIFVFWIHIMNTCTQSSQNQHYHNLSYEHNALFFLKLTKVNNDTFIDMWMKSLTLLWWRMWGIRYTKLTYTPIELAVQQFLNKFSTLFYSVLMC